MKKINLILIALIYICFGLFAQGDPINLTLPKISEGNVFNSSYFYGPISVESTYDGDKLNKKAYYSLDGGQNWGDANISDTSSFKNEIDFNANVTEESLVQWKTKIVDLGENGFALIYYHKDDISLHYYLYCDLYNTKGSLIKEKIKLFGENEFRSLFDVVSLPDSRFVIVWVNRMNYNNEDSFCVIGSCFSKDAEQIDENFVIYSEKYDQLTSSISIQAESIPGKGYVVLYNRRISSDGNSFICSRLYDKLNIPISNEIVLGNFDIWDTNSKIIGLQDGGFIFFRPDNTTSLPLVGKRFNFAGMLVDSNFRLNSSENSSEINYKSIKIIENQNGFDVIYLNDKNLIIEKFDQNNISTNKTTIYTYTDSTNLYGTLADITLLNNSVINISMADNTRKKVLMRKYNENLDLLSDIVMVDNSSFKSQEIHSLEIKKISTDNVYLNLINSHYSIYSNIKDVSIGYDCITLLKEDGTVVCWGSNRYGQCDVPAGLSNVKSISVGVGSARAVAVKEDGTVVMWGINNWGEGIVPDGLTNVKSVDVTSPYVSVALKEDGTVFVWGKKYHVLINKMPAGLSNVKQISVGGDFIVALKENGTVVAWGDNTVGQCNVPVGLTDVKFIISMDSSTVALKNNGTAVFWGYDDNGLLKVPQGLNNVKQIAMGLLQIVALKEDGTIVSWGEYRWCELFTC